MSSTSLIKTTHHYRVPSWQVVKNIAKMRQLETRKIYLQHLAYKQITTSTTQKVVVQKQFIDNPAFHYLMLLPNIT